MNISIGPVVFHVYGFILGIALLVGAEVSQRFSRQAKVPVSVWGILPWMLGFGLLGARLYHIVDLWEYYQEQPLMMLALWNGGLGIYGGIAGGILGLWLSRRRLPNSILTVLDVMAVGMPIAQAIGRWGNFFNQELYGLPTDAPWGIFIDIRHRIVGYELFERFHPLFFYESLWCLVIFNVLYFWLYAKKHQRVGGGVYLSTYLFLYAFGRFWLEFLRINPWRIDGLWLTTAQLVAIGVWFIGLMCFVCSKMRK